MSSEKLGMSIKPPLFPLPTPPPESPAATAQDDPYLLQPFGRRMIRFPSLEPAGAYLWLGLYFVLNLTLTLYNKAVMKTFNFGYPWTLTGIHTLCSAIGAFICYRLGYFHPAKLGERESMVMLLFSVLYTINIAISNVSLNLVSVPFHQVVRAMTPLFTILLSLAFLGKRYSTLIYLSLVPIVAGVAFATFGEYNYTMAGFVLTVLGTVLAALKTVVTNRVQVGRLKLHPLDLLLRMSPLAFVQTMVYAYVTGELEELQEFAMTDLTWPLVAALLANGAMAFFLNVVSFTANKKTSALTMTVAGNVKQVLTILLAVAIFADRISWLNGVGIALTLAGGAWYTSLELKEKQQKRQMSNDSLPSLSEKLQKQLQHEEEQHLLSIKTMR
ncbi:uncharacterized protein VTP21DRAFT_4569 [Calcarisporiella thermophila]|uniref:uncharacterized protein n=1 Tax=Calcarisporiella thermophila TaxID=911321 RepID=UPI0037421806